jgi:hypothetical protein
MLLYRVSPYQPGSEDGAPGSPTYLHKPQRDGRIDNPIYYNVWYLSLTAAGAVGETFASHPKWPDELFDFGTSSDTRFALHTFKLSDACRVLDLDDAHNLAERVLRPTQIVTLNRSVTQGWALRIWNELAGDRRRWDGVRWWSRHSAEWPIIALWTGTPTHVDTEDLSTKHKAVVEAASVLNRSIIPPTPKS